MIYNRDWVSLQATVSAIVRHGQSEEEAKHAVCGLLADRRIKFIAEASLEPGCLPSRLRPDAMGLADVMVPYDLQPSGIDWENSRPCSPWWADRLAPSGLPVRIPRHIQIDRLLIYGPDVIAALNLEGRPSEEAPPASSRPSRGPKAHTLVRVVEEMRRDLSSGKVTAKRLSDESEKALASQYGASRDTIRKARNAVQSKPVETPKQ